MASVEDILLYQAQQDAQARGENNAETAALGAFLGGASAASGAASQRNLGEALQKLRKGTKGRPTGTSIKQAIDRQKPVVKGGVAGAVLGGILALVAKQAMQRDSLAGELYAKRIAGEPMTAAEAAATERLIAETVSSNRMV